MAYNGEGVQALMCAIEDLRGANLLYSDKMLARVLKCLAYYDELNSVIARCNRGFDYNAEKQKVLTVISDRPAFKMPKSPKSRVAFVSGLLFEFDQKTEDLMGFIGKYFPSASKSEGFEMFYEAVLVPFKQAVAELVVSGNVEAPQIVERAVDFAPAGLASQAASLLISVYDEVNAATLTEEVRGKINVAIEGFAAALDARDTLFIKSIWYGLEELLSSSRLCEKECEQINSVLTMYLVS